jgi:hypothetical protein
VGFVSVASVVLAATRAAGALTRLSIDRRSDLDTEFLVEAAALRQQWSENPLSR